MKKVISALSIVALLAGANIAAAKNQDNDDKGNKFREQSDSRMDGRIKIGWPKFDRHNDDDDDNNRFVVMGNITAKTATNLTLSVHAGNRDDINGTLTVVINADTEVKGPNDVDTLADLSVGNRIVIKGTVTSSVYTAETLHMVPQRQPKLVGAVTAVTDTSVTIKNNITGEEKVVIVEPDTKVNVNGEVMTAADIQVGDKGWIKFKTNVEGIIAKVISLFR